MYPPLADLSKLGWLHRFRRKWPYIAGRTNGCQLWWQHTTWATPWHLCLERIMPAVDRVMLHIAWKGATPGILLEEWYKAMETLPPAAWNIYIYKIIPDHYDYFFGWKSNHVFSILSQQKICSQSVATFFCFTSWDIKMVFLISYSNTVLQ